MDITWNVTITPQNVAKKTASVLAVRRETDNTDPQNPVILKQTQYVIQSVILDTAQQKTDALNQIWQQHQDRLALDVVISNYIGNLEATAKANLEVRE